MTLNQLIETLQKVKATIAAGADDAAVVIHALEDDAKSVIQRIEVAFNAGPEGVTPEVTVLHGPATPAPEAPEADPTLDTELPAAT